MTRERVWLTRINTQLITANTDVNAVVEDNVVHVDFGAMASAAPQLTALAA